MENRRPPHAKSSGRYTDRTRGNTSYRGGGGGSGGPARDRNIDRPQGGRYKDRPGDGTQRREAPGRKNDGRPAAARGRYGNRAGDTRRRGQIDDRNGPETEVKITSDAQITDGKFRGKRLLNSVSPYAVPTNRTVREIAFKALSRRVKAGRFLDLGAGAGTIGIEAISRGAMLATFVERSARMCSLIRKNLSALEIKNGHGEVIEMEALPFLKRTARRRREWDVVYLDLSNDESHAAIVDHLSRASSIKVSGVLVLQHASSSTFPEKINCLTRRRTVEQGETILSIYERI
jgi:16S rRNA (guanine(966)-N(2))-methyltransferase RsmD